MKAFPYFREIDSPKEGYKAYVHEDGMDLRDYFAKDFCVVLMTQFSVSHTEEFKLNICKQGYAWADAMMKAREK